MSRITTITSNISHYPEHLCEDHYSHNYSDHAQGKEFFISHTFPFMLYII